MKLEPYSLPETIEARLLSLMGQLGLVMGSIDMIVTPEGDHVFLEVNEQGQFLWVEQMNPEIALLEPFAHFLASGNPLFCWAPRSDERIEFLQYLESPEAREFISTEAASTYAESFVVSDR